MASIHRERVLYLFLWMNSPSVFQSILSLLDPVTDSYLPAIRTQLVNHYIELNNVLVCYRYILTISDTSLFKTNQVSIFWNHVKVFLVLHQCGTNQCCGKHYFWQIHLYSFGFGDWRLDNRVYPFDFCFNSTIYFTKRKASSNEVHCYIKAIINFYKIKEYMIPEIARLSLVYCRRIKK